MVFSFCLKKKKRKEKKQPASNLSRGVGEGGGVENRAHQSPIIFSPSLFHKDITQPQPQKRKRKKKLVFFVFFVFFPVLFHQVQAEIYSTGMNTFSFLFLFSL
jgi:hypothetical protein